MATPSFTSAAADGRAVLARLDRLPTWPLPWTHLAILGLGYLFTFYNLAGGALAMPALGVHFGLAITVNLLVTVVAGVLGYVVGSIAGGGLADGAGRISILAPAMAIAAVGSLAAALAGGPLVLAGSRLLTGAGLGAVVNLTSTYVGELAPSAKRGRLSGITFLIGSLGLAPAPAVALFLGARGTAGWRWVFAIGCLIAVGALLVRLLPESPRWLVQRGQVDRAAEVLDRLEASVRARGLELAEPDPSAGPDEQGPARSFGALRQPPYQQRTYLLVAMWVLWYLGVYGLLGVGSTLLAGPGYGGPLRIALMVAPAVGFPIGAALTAVVADRFDRRVLLLCATAAWLAGMALAAPLRGGLLIAVGLFLGSAGIGLYLQPALTYTGENFPTRARASGFGVAEGGGQLGGAVGVLALPAIVAATSFPFGLVAVGVIGLAAGLLALSGPRTTGRRLEDVSA